MEPMFGVILIETNPIQTQRAVNFLHANCTHIYCTDEMTNYWIYEGDDECLSDAGVDYYEHGEGYVGCLGHLSQKGKIQLVLDEFGVDVRD